MKYLNLIGLMSDIIGAVLMYLNTPYISRKLRTSSGMNLLKDAAWWLSQGKELERKEAKMLKVGFGLLMVGFILQFIATLWQ